LFFINVLRWIDELERMDVKMIDFTKEELKLIMEGVLYLRGGCTNYAMDSEKLKIKIQSMIDNYCDHEPEGDYHVCVDKCRKCGVIM
jgi:hypothetical protein